MVVTQALAPDFQPAVVVAAVAVAAAAHGEHLVELCKVEQVAAAAGVAV